jgi:hypothetical protein
MLRHSVLVRPRLLPSLLHQTFVCEAAERRLPMGPSRSERGRGVVR